MARRLSKCQLQIKDTEARALNSGKSGLSEQITEF
jgi:hypothetical protein